MNSNLTVAISVSGFTTPEEVKSFMTTLGDALAASLSSPAVGGDQSSKATLTATTTAITTPVINTTNKTARIALLRKLQSSLTDRQLEVWDYFKSHPGHVWSNDLKQALPWIAQPGSLPGTFKATQKWIRLGGKREDSPFYQLDYLRERGGKYIGLQQDEVDEL